MKERKEMFKFNDALNTFYLRLHGVKHNMVQDHLGSERGNPLPPHGHRYEGKAPSFI